MKSLLIFLLTGASAMTFSNTPKSRRSFFSKAASAAVLVSPSLVLADRSDLQDRVNTDNFLRTGMDSSPMGVSGQAGKSRPKTGVFLNEGSEILYDKRTKTVSAEILIDEKKTPVLVSFSSPWPLAKGSQFDVEMRDGRSGDGAFVAVADCKGKGIEELKDSFFVNAILGEFGRFSAYGSPTDIKIKGSTSADGYKFIDVQFSIFSQSTNAEIPRRALFTAKTINKSAIILVSGSTLARWKQVEPDARAASSSFVAVPAPQSSLRSRGR